MKWLRPFLAGVAVLIVPFLFLQGLSNSKTPPGPVNWNGFWQADLSLAFLQIEQEDGSLSVNVQDSGLELARSAFAKEPLASNALFLVATDYRAAGDTDSMRELLDLAAGLDKRNRNVGGMQLEQAALSGNLVATFDILERLSLVNPELTQDLVQPLTAALEDERSIQFLRDALIQQPTWAEAFWMSIPATKTGIVNMQAMRLQAGVGATPDSDARLLAGLVQLEQFEAALDLWNGIAGEGQPDTAFVPTSDYAPVGWRTASSGERSFNQRERGEFDAYVEDQTFGELARQIVRLEPGTYRFSAKISPVSDGEDFEAELRCVEAGGMSLGSQSLVSPTEWEVGDGCGIYWLILSATAWERTRPLRATVSNMEFAPID